MVGIATIRANPLTEGERELVRSVRAGEDYAAKFVRGRSWSPGFLVATVGALVATLVAAGHVVGTMVGVFDRSLARSLLVYGIAAVALVSFVFVGSRIDRRLPPDIGLLSTWGAVAGRVSRASRDLRLGQKRSRGNASDLSTALDRSRASSTDLR